MDRQKLEALLQEAKSWPEMTLCTDKARISIGQKTFSYFTKDANENWILEGELPHNIEFRTGVLVPNHWYLYLWNGFKCYELDQRQKLLVDFGIFLNGKYSIRALSDMTKEWQWNEVDPEIVIGGYLANTGRDELETKVTDRETRDRNRRSALNELQNGSYIGRLPMNTFWTRDQLILKYEQEIKDFEYKEKRALEQAQREAEREALKQKALETAEELLSEKNYKMAAILAIVLGSLGAHKFYMGKYKMGILYLVFCWTWIPGIIGVIEGLIYLIQGPEKFEERLQ